MNPPDRPGRRRPRRTRAAGSVAALLVALAVALSGCGAVSALLDTQQGLRDAGYQSVSVHFAFNRGGDRVDVHVAVAAPPTPDDVRSVASVVWQRLHQRFTILDVSVRGTGTGAGQVLTGTYTFADLRGMFGARDPRWDKTTIGQSAEHLGLAIVGSLAAAAVAVAVIAIVITRRNRRRRPPWGGGGAPLWPPPPGPPSPDWSPAPPTPAGPPPGPVWSPGPPPPGRPWTPGDRTPGGDGGWGPPRPPD
ncbi:MAG TPA: hypothetical protein VGL49_06750 [Acidimicrobiales bacterium]|jgi:hypothetical protein